jgi:GNAT superfamily N-acetyltransferase
MADSVLDNPIWASLTTLHRTLAIEDGEGLRYPAEVAPFLGVPRGGAAIPPPDMERFLVGPRPVPPPGWRVEGLGNLVQMTCEAPLSAFDGPAIVPLTERTPVLELTALVYPHYFRPRTMELGRYFGVIEGGRLAAMIGERMGMPGFREVSAVCTHPDFVGRGLARHLLAFLSNDLLSRGHQPFLHVSPSNARAVELYRRNGYRVRAEPEFWAIQRAK